MNPTAACVAPPRLPTGHLVRKVWVRFSWRNWFLFD